MTDEYKPKKGGTVRHINLLEEALEALHTGDDKEKVIHDIKTYLSYQGTHSKDCWSWGAQHYMCAYNKIKQLEKELAQLND